MTVGELGQRLSSAELTYWIEYFQLEPFGPVRDNLHAGIISATLANVNRSPGRQVMKASDFLLKSKEERQNNSVSEFIAWLNTVASEEDEQ